MILSNADRIAKTWWDGFASSDVERLVSLFDEDASFWDPRFPPFRGKAAIEAYYRDLLSKTTDWGGTMEAPYLCGDDRFAVRTRSRFRSRRGGPLIDMPLVAFFRIRPSDGAVVLYEEYWDTLYVLRQLGMTAWSEVGSLHVRETMPSSQTS
jgi:ketosteroid isomerase-like protein